MSGAGTALASSLIKELALHQPGFGLRAETEGDMNFLIALYTSTRWDELAPVDWPEAAKLQFLAQQCRLQHAHYLEHYAGAERLLITAPRARVRDAGDASELWPDPNSADDAVIGRVYLRQGSTEIRLMDIALLPPLRGAGIGRCLIEALKTQAALRGLDLTLHVEPNNPAQRLYQRLGFSLIEQRGVYDFLGWSPAR